MLSSWCASQVGNTTAIEEVAQVKKWSVCIYLPLYVQHLFLLAIVPNDVGYSL